MKIKNEDIAEAVKDSEEVELSKDHKRVRRHGGKALPKQDVDSKGKGGVQKRRDAKAQDKEEAKEEKKQNKATAG